MYISRSKKVETFIKIVISIFQDIFQSRKIKPGSFWETQ